MAFAGMVFTSAYSGFCTDGEDQLDRLSAGETWVC